VCTKKCVRCSTLISHTFSMVACETSLTNNSSCWYILRDSYVMFFPPGRESSREVDDGFRALEFKMYVPQVCVPVYKSNYVSSETRQCREVYRKNRRNSECVYILYKYWEVKKR
jgi:hypothetical protein